MSESETQTILDVIKNYPDGISRGELQQQLSFQMSGSTLYRRLRELVENQEIGKKGKRSGTKYFLIRKNLDSLQIKNQVSRLEKTNISDHETKSTNFSSHIFNPQNIEILEYLKTPVYARKSSTYNRDFLNQYEPNKTFYLSDHIRQELANKGKRIDTLVAAGTYARNICDRLLIDLSYNSSRLEGNTYSELDTKKLIDEQIRPEGKIQEETVMILNHKEAISFLVDNAENIDITLFTIRNLHYLLAQDLLVNPMSCGDVRKNEVHISGTTYQPISGYLLLQENLELLLLKARKIEDSYEQSFFLLLHLSYLQAFEDVNKRTARLACNIPFIKNNQCPLSFVDLPKDDYVASLIMFYERNIIEPMVEVFKWAYLKSCERYDTVRDSLGEVDEFRVRYRRQRKECIGEIIRKNLHGSNIEEFTYKYCQKNQINQQDRFVTMIITQLDMLHSGAIVGMGISESQFEVWKKEQA